MHPTLRPPRPSTRWLARIAGIGLLPLVIAGAASGSAIAANPSTTATLPAPVVDVTPVVLHGLAPGAVVSRNGLRAVVPAVGTGVEGEALLADGTSRSLEVRTLADGRILVTASATTRAAGAGQESGSASVSRPGAIPNASPAACSDRRFNLNASFLHATFRWAFRSSSRPSNLTTTAAANAFKRAQANITREHNNCGRADRVSATGTYLGTTTATANIGSSASCLNPDGRNVVTFGTLPAGFVGFSCWWFIGNDTKQADMRLNKRDFAWLATPSGCTSQFLIEAVATHEFGHIFGLAHVAEATHGNLTMSTALPACDNSPSTLGLGDMLGLERRY